MIELLLAYKVYIGLAIIVILALLSLKSDVLQKQMKKLLILLLTVSGVGMGYYFFTGQPPNEIPGAINRFFSDPHVKDEPSHRYYKDPSERYGDQLK